VSSKVKMDQLEKNVATVNRHRDFYGPRIRDKRRWQRCGTGFTISMGLGRRRFIRDGATIRKSVLIRIEQVPGYHPSNLPKNYETEPAQDQAERPVAIGFV
jgi:hypothetical protein